MLQSSLQIPENLISNQAMALKICMSLILILNCALLAFTVSHQKFYLLGKSAFSASHIYRHLTVGKKLACMNQCLIDRPTCFGFNLHFLKEGAWRCELVNNLADEWELTSKNESFYYRIGKRCGQNLFGCNETIHTCMQLTSGSNFTCECHKHPLVCGENCDEEAFTVTYGKTMLEPKLALTIAETPEQCFKDCLNYPGCTAVDYRPQVSKLTTCLLKNKVLTPSNQYIMPIAIHAERNANQCN